VERSGEGLSVGEPDAGRPGGSMDEDEWGFGGRAQGTPLYVVAVRGVLEREGLGQGGAIHADI
jgi:hypothetical protein